MLPRDSQMLLLAPNRIGYTSNPVDCESLHRKQDYGDLDNDQLLGLRDHAERNDESRRSRRRMTYPQQRHERASSRERESRGQQPCAMDTGVDAKGRARVGFGVLTYCGYRQRRNPGAHKRLTMLATISLLPASPFSMTGIT